MGQESWIILGHISRQSMSMEFDDGNDYDDDYDDDYNDDYDDDNE